MSKVPELVSKAKSFLAKPGAEQSDDCWQAYVCMEYAILDLKLSNKMEALPVTAAKRRRVKMTPAEKLAAAREKLDALKLDQEPPELLQSLRDCREPLKDLVANYDRGLRSTTS